MHLDEIFQPPIKEMTFLDRSMLVGHEIYPSRGRIYTPREVFTMLYPFFAKKRSEIGMLIGRKTTNADIYCAVAFQMNKFDFNSSLLEPLLKMKVVFVHSHPQYFTTKLAREYNEIWIELGVPFPAGQLLPTPQEKSFSERLSNKFPGLMSFLIGPDGCVAYHPYNKINFYSRTIIVKEKSKFKESLKGIIQKI